RVELDVGRDRLALGVHLENLLAPVRVGAIDDDLPVETAWAEKRRVQDVGPVRGRDQDDVVLQLEPVHLDEELVQGLLALVMAAAEAGASVPADGVDLVHEDDERGGVLCLLKGGADTPAADTDKLLDEGGAGDREEGNPRLPGQGASEQRLPR